MSNAFILFNFIAKCILKSNKLNDRLLERPNAMIQICGKFKSKTRHNTNSVMKLKRKKTKKNLVNIHIYILSSHPIVRKSF